MQKITPCLWFDDRAEEAVKFYTSIFSKSKVLGITHYFKENEETSGKPAGSVLTISFKLNGQDYTALNGGPQFKFNEAISLVVNCKDQKEIDYYWDKLTDGGDEKAQACGWLKDKFGVSWQVTPTILNKMLLGKDQAKARRAMAALLKMKKIDIAALKKAYAGK